MYAVEKLSSYITKGVYTVSGPFHPFGGAVDIIVVQQKDGSYKSSPWYVRFGKFQGVLKSKEKVVTICVNGEEAKFHMYLDHKGEAYFLKEWDFNDSGDSEISSHSSGDEVEENDRKLRFKKVQSSNYDGGQREKVVFVENEHEKIVTVENGNGKNEPIEIGNGKIVTRTRSKRAMLYRLMFGGKQINGNGKNTNVDTVEEKEITAIEVEKENKESTVNSETAISNEEGACDSLGTRVLTREDIDDFNPCSSGDGNVEELKNSLKEDTENCRVNLDVVVENDDGEVKSIIHTETSETLTISTERNGSISGTLLSETDTVIESCIECDTDNLELSCTKVTCITQDSLSKNC